MEASSDKSPFVVLNHIPCPNGIGPNRIHRPGSLVKEQVSQVKATVS